jgi:hypothetical protein
LEGLIFEMLNLMGYKRRTMNSKLWIRKALSTCLVIATVLTYSMVTLAGSEKIAGEILITGKSADGQAPLVKVNGETAQSGRSIFSSSTIATPENAGAVISLGKIGKIELAPNTILAVSFSEKGISGDLSAGRVTVLNSANGVVINTTGGKSLTLNAGDSASAQNQQKDDTTSDNDGGSAGLIYAVILGGAVAGIIFAATRGNDNAIPLGGGATVVSPTR